MLALLFSSKQKKLPSRLDSANAGFTLVEVLVVALMVGILSVISGAGYLAWLDRLRLNAAQDIALNAIRDAQITANQRLSTWQVSFRETNGRIQWAVHDAKQDPPIWNTIEHSGVKIDPAKTTFYKDTKKGLWRVQFNYKGRTNGQLGKITLSNYTGRNKRCTIVSTLLGAVRTAQDKRC